MSNSAFEAVRRQTVAGAAAGRRAGAVLGRTAAASARSVKFWALASIALAAAIAAVITIPAASVERDAPAFLAKSLGAPAPTAPLARVSAEGIRTAVTPVGYSFRNGSSRLTLASQDVVASNGTAIPWERRANGAFRKTSFGNEAIIFKNDGQIEQLMTVGKRMGEKTWSWRIASNVGYPRVGDDGYVAFIKDNVIRQDVVIKPVILYDAQGKDITPEGLRWNVSQDGRGYLLELKLNDRKLPVPYVIDPIAAANSASTASTSDGSSLVLNKPAGIANGDVVFASTAISGTTGNFRIRTSSTSALFSAFRNSTQTVGPTNRVILWGRVMQGTDTTANWTFEDTLAGSQSFAVSLGAFTGVQVDTISSIQYPGIDLAPTSTTGYTGNAMTPNQDNEILFWGFAHRAGGGFSAVTGGYNQTVTGGAFSTGGAFNTSAELVYRIGGTQGVAVSGPTITPVTSDVGTALVAHMSFRVSDNAPPTLANFKVASATTITFDMDDPNVLAGPSNSGVGVAPTVPPANRFSVKYTPTGGGLQNLTPTSATITGNTVTLTFPASTFATPGTVLLSYNYTPSTTGTTLNGTYTTSSATMTVAGTSNFPSSGRFVVTGSTSQGPASIAQVYTYSAKTATTFTVTPLGSIVGSFTTGNAVSIALQDRDGNKVASFTDQAVVMDGAGTAVISPNEVTASTTSTQTITYTVGAAGMVNGEVNIAVPTGAGWTTPTLAAAAGKVSLSGTGSAGATLGVTGSTITITGVNATSGQTLIVTYGDTGGGGSAASTPGSAPQTNQFTTTQKATSSGTLTGVVTQPSVGVVIAPDGSGTMTVSPTSRAAGSTGETLTFTYTANATPVGGAMSNGEVRLAIPSGWTTPTTSSGNPGYSVIGTGCAGCSLSVSGSEIRVTGVTLTGGASFTIVYGSGVGGGVTVPQTPGQVATFTTTQRSLATSTLTPVATQPTVTITGVDGGGTIAVTNPIVATSSVNTHVFTYTLGTGGMYNGAITVTVPGAWPTPQDTSATSTNFTTLGSGTATAGTLSISGNVITVDGITGTSGQTVVFTYGDTSGGAAAITEPASAQVGTFTTQQKAHSGGTLTSLASQPTISAVADGAGTCAISPTTVATSTSTTQTITCTIASGGMSNGAFAVTVPASWTVAPQTAASSSPGYADLGTSTANTPGTLSTSGQVITVSGISGTSGQTVVIRYGSTSGSPTGVATSPSAAETSNFAITQRSTGGGTLTSISSNPHNVTVTPPDGQGTCVVSPTSVATSTQTTQTFTCTIGAAGLVSGAIAITVPTGWTAPQTSVNTNPGFTDLGSGTATSQGTVSTSGQVITVSGITGTSGQTVIVRYGSTAGGAGGQAVSRSTGGTNNFPVTSRGSSGGTLTAISSSPLQVTTVPPDGAGTCAVSPSSVTVSTTTTITMTCTIAAGGMQSGAFAVTIPAGWTAPQTGSATSGGYSEVLGTSTADTPGTISSIVGQVINVTGVTGDSGETVIIRYGSTSGGGGGAATSQSTVGTPNFAVTQRSTSGGTLTSVSSNPHTVTVNAPDGQGTCAVSPTSVATSTATTLTFTCTIAAAGVAGGAFAITVPTGWTAPQTSVNTNPGFTDLGSGTATSQGSVSASGQVITVSGITGTSGQTVIVRYGSTAGGAGGQATSRSTGGTNDFPVTSRGSSGGTLTTISSSPLQVTTVPPDGAGTCAVSPTSVIAATTTTITMTCTIASGGMQSGAFAMTVPTGWTAPQVSVSTNPGYTEVLGASTATTPGTASVSGQVVTVSGITGTSGQTVIIRYGSTSGGAGGAATSQSTVGTPNFAVTQRSTSGGTLTSVSSNPHTVTVHAPDGQGTCAVSPTTTPTSTATTLTFTCTIASGGMQSGAFAMTVPTGWTAPQVSVSTNPGYTEVLGASTATTPGTASVSGQVVTVSGITGTSGQTVIIRYGSTSGGAGGAATSQSTVGTPNFAVTQRSTSGGTLTSVSSNPHTVTVHAPDGQGTCAVSPTTTPTSTATTLTFTCTIGSAGLATGAFAITVPSGWTAPQVSVSTNPGYTEVLGTSTADTPGTASVSGQVINVTGIAGDSGETVIIRYGSTSGGAGGAATSPSVGGVNNFAITEKGSTGGTLTSISSNPHNVTVIPPDGAGTCVVSPTSVATSTSTTITMTCTIASGGMQSGAFAMTVPTGWTAPQVSVSTNPGYTEVLGTSTATTPGTASVSGQVVTVSGITGTSGQTVIIRYGSTSGGAGGAATSQSTGGTPNFAVTQRSTSSGTLTSVSSNPHTVTVIPPDGAGTCAVSPTSVATSTATTLTFTCTIASGGVQSGAFAVTVPSGWTAPQTGSSTSGGYTELSGTSTAGTPGTLGVSGQTITVSGITGTSGQTVVIVYGSTTGGPGGRTTSPSTGGTSNFPVTQRSTSGGTLTAISSSPIPVTVVPPDGAGTCAVSPTSVGVSQSTTLTFTCTIASGGMQSGAFAVTVPSGWTAPQTGSIATAGYTLISGSSTAGTPGTVATSGQVINVTGVTGTSGQTVVIVYGSTTGNPAGATTSSSTAGTNNFPVTQRSTSSGTLTAISSSPLQVTTTASDGIGSCAVTPTTATGGQPTALTFTCTLAGTMTSGAFQVAIPTGWTTPQTGTPTGGGYTVLLTGSSTATTPGTLAVSGMNVDITGITGTTGQTVVFVYGSTVGGGPGSTPPSTGGTVTFTSKQKSTAGGTLTGITSPTVTVTIAATPLLPPAPNGGTVDDTEVEITWDGPIDPSGIPPLSSLKVVSSVTGTHNVIAISISNGKLLLTLDTPVTPGETARAIYTKPSGPGLKGTNGVDVVSFDQPLANRGRTTGTGASPVGIPTDLTNDASTCGSSTLFFMTATYGSGRTITLVFCRTFDERVVPSPAAFQVSTSNKGRLVPVKVAVSGRTVLLTLPEGQGLVAGETAVVSYARPDASALVDTITPTANEALSFMGAQVVNLTGGTAVLAARAATDVLPTTPPRLVSSSPDDGITVPRMLAITMLASKDVTWTNVRVLRSDGTTLDLPSFSGARYTQPFVPTQNGPYMVTATISDGSNAPVPVTVNFSVYTPPPSPTVASAGTAPEVSKVTQGGSGGAIVASDGSASVSWPGTLFKSKTIVTVEPLPVVASPKGIPSITANFAVGSIAIGVVARNSTTGAEIKEFDTPIHLEFPNGTPLGVPSYSPNGLTWIPLPRLEKNELPAGQKDGYFRDENNTVHIWTRHLTYFAILKPGDLLRVTAAPHIWAVNKRRTIAFMVQSGRKATLTAQPQLYVKGSKSHVTLWKPLKMKQGTRVFRYYLPKKHKMVGTFELRVKFQVGKKTLVRKRTIEFLPEKYKPAKRPVVVRINGLNNAARLSKSLRKSYVVKAYRTGPTSIPYVANKKNKVDAVVIDLTRSPYNYANRIGLIRNLRWIFPDLRIAVITKDKKMAQKADQWGSDATSRPPGGSYQLKRTLMRALQK